MINFWFLVPISIHPFFWLVISALSYYVGGKEHFASLFGILFVAVLFHEFGHAVAAKAFGKKPRIALVASGGITTYNYEGLSLIQQFFIVFMGPLFGYFLSLASSLPLQFLQIENPALIYFLTTSASINLFLVLANLVPIFPLDGGHMLKIIMQGLFGLAAGVRATFVLSGFFAFSLSLFFFLGQNYLFGALLFYLGLSSAVSWQQHRRLAKEDFDSEVQQWLAKGEELETAKKPAEAASFYQKIRAKVHCGEIFELVTFRLALIHYKAGEWGSAFGLLKELEKDLSPEGIMLLHEIAIQHDEMEIVRRYAAEAYRWSQEFHDEVVTASIALHNAYAFASVGDAVNSVHWLRAAYSDGLQNPVGVMQDEQFKAVAASAEFIALQTELKQGSHDKEAR